MALHATGRGARVWLIAALLVLVPAAPASAAGPRDEFMLAMQALRQGDAERAATLFARVYEQARVPIALYGLGLALRRLGRFDEAARAFEGYVERADPQRYAKRVERAKALSKELREREDAQAGGFGPVLSVGLPRVFGVGLQLRASRHLAFAAELRLSPAFDYGIVDVGGRSVDLSLRLHPFGNAFLLLGGLSFEHLFGEATYRDVRVEGEADSVALIFGAGASSDSGLLLGVDANFVLDVSRSALELRTVEGAVPPGIDPQLAVDRVAREIEERRGDFPQVVQATLRLGYLF